MIAYNQAILEALDQSMECDENVYVMGLGVPDPKGIFGTTLGLQEKYGPERVMDMPLAENAMTGVAIGSALTGLRPVMTHQRVDFALVALEQIINQAAKWHFMFDGQQSVPMVVRMIIGRGWGQGPQHSQGLQALFGHIPGLKVVMPTTAHDVKGMLISAVEDNNPVIVLEHRWLYGIKDDVPEAAYRVPLGKAKVMREGSDITLVAMSYMSVEALRAAEQLAEHGINAEVIDLRSIRPLDEETILKSVSKTGRLLVVDSAHLAFGTSAEIISLVTEKVFSDLKQAPSRMGLPDYPAPTSPALCDDYYPRSPQIIEEILKQLGRTDISVDFSAPTDHRLDQPDPNFSGPF
jgi:pyruvate dehydrogenase E1 component beta subunit